jgi:uncharacterized protein (AIM24 family)
VDYDIQFVGGFKNVMLGGEGIFPGKIEGSRKGVFTELALFPLG